MQVINMFHNDNNIKIRMTSKNLRKYSKLYKQSNMRYNNEPKNSQSFPTTRILGITMKYLVSWPLRHERDATPR